MSFCNNDSFGIQIENNNNMDVDEPSKSSYLLTSLITSKINTSLYNLIFILESKLKQNIKRVFFNIRNSSSDENLEKKINDFFMKIQKLKNDNKDLADLEFLMNDELIKNSETDRKLNSRRLNDFIEKIDNNRQLDRTIRPKFYFLSPIKFSTKDLSD